MFGLPGLEQAASRFFAAPGAARRLLQQLERALGGARIAIGEADIGVDDADQSQKREIMALGDELRADDDVVGAARRLLQLMAQMLQPAGKIGGENQQPRLRKQRLRFLGEPLDAGSASGQAVGFLACRADVGALFDMAAMMADERAAKAMLDQPGRAIGALEAMAAGAAQSQRRIAAPVEEQQRLFAARQPFLDAGDQGAATASARAAAPRGAGRWRRAAAALRSPNRAASLSQPIAALFGVDARFDRRRRRGENDRRAFQPRAHHRHVARMIGDALFLLIGAFMFLIDDDEAEPRRTAGTGPSGRRRRRAPRRWRRAPHRRSRRRAGTPECHSAGRTPKRAAKRSRNCAVSAISGSRISACRPARSAARHRLEIDFGLAGSGDAFEQDRAERALLDRRRPEPAPLRAWSGSSVAGAKSGIRDRRDRLWRQSDDFEGAVVDQSVDDARRRIRPLPRARIWRARFVAKRGQNALARRRRAASAPCPSCARPRRGGGRAGRLRRARRHAQHHAARRQRPAGNPVDQIEQRLAQRRPVAELGDGFEIVAARASRIAQMTPVVWLRPSGISTNWPARRCRPAGTR